MSERPPQGQPQREPGTAPGRPPGKVFKKCKSATFQIDGATYTIVDNGQTTNPGLICSLFGRCGHSNDVNLQNISRRHGNQISSLEHSVTPLLYMKHGKIYCKRTSVPMETARNICA
ncbi:hypothetical protein CBL_03256 [Carabus blaptoides fortunei]